MNKYDCNPISVCDVINNLPVRHSVIKELPKPDYEGVCCDGRLKLGLAVKSMVLHTSNEGYELFQGLEHNGYILAGYDLQINLVDINRILKTFYPGTIVIQDPREWEGKTAGYGFNKREKFTNEIALSQESSIFKLTIVKDAHQENAYHAEHCNTMGINAFICYYNPIIVKHLAPYTRFKHLIRTYHTINRDIIPNFSSGKDRGGALLSGAMSSSYPLRSKLKDELYQLYQTTYLPHPGYVRTKCHTPEFLHTLNKFKVAICTSSMYGYAIRKIFEATACGCIVLTDLPIDDKIPHIDENLVRISPLTPTKDVKSILCELINSYDEERQRHYANLAKEHYDFRAVTKKLVQDIEKMRLNYNKE